MMNERYEDRWETFGSVFDRFSFLDRKEIIRDNSNTCIKNKSVYNGLTHYWYKHLGVL